MTREKSLSIRFGSVKSKSSNACRDKGRNEDSQYFCQTLLVDYMQERDVEWDVVWDDRGHFTEPHTGRTIGLGTLNVRNYLRGN
jgi:hypothetical protein